MVNKSVKQFISPSITRRSILRIVLTATGAYLFFAYICMPVRIQGNSMEPTYSNGSINFCWRQAFHFSEIRRFDVVFVKFAGVKYMLMKRVIALAGETVEFRKGKLIIDGELIDESHIEYPYDWNLAPKQVRFNHVYVVGDNRTVPMDRHDFGQTAIRRIIGAPLW